jgi:hypothetical protein
MNKRLPWLWLEGSEDEVAAVAACGCKLHRDFYDSGDPAFEMCAIHKAAPEMLKALRSAKELLPPQSEVPQSDAAHVCLDFPARLVRKIRRLTEKLS